MVSPSRSRMNCAAATAAAVCLLMVSWGCGGGGSSVTLTKVTPVAPVISWPTPAAISQGTALSATQLDATATVAGTFAYSPASGTVPAAGNQTLSVTSRPQTPLTTPRPAPACCSQWWQPARTQPTTGFRFHLKGSITRPTQGPVSSRSAPLAVLRLWASEWRPQERSTRQFA